MELVVVATLVGEALAVKKFLNPTKVLKKWNTGQKTGVKRAP